MGPKLALGGLLWSNFPVDQSRIPKDHSRIPGDPRRSLLVEIVGPAAVGSSLTPEPSPEPNFCTNESYVGDGWWPSVNGQTSTTAISNSYQATETCKGL